MNYFSFVVIFMHNLVGNRPQRHSLCLYADKVQQTGVICC